MAYIVMPYIVVAYIVMAYIVMPYIVVAYIVMARPFAVTARNDCPPWLSLWLLTVTAGTFLDL